MSVTFFRPANSTSEASVTKENRNNVTNLFQPNAEVNSAARRAEQADAERFQAATKLLTTAGMFAAMLNSARAAQTPSQPTTPPFSRSR